MQNENRQSIKVTTLNMNCQRILDILATFTLIHSDEGLTLETSVFESFTVANLPYDLVVDNLF